MASPAAWLAATFGGLWTGSLIAQLTRYAVSLTALEIALVALGALILLAIVMHSRRAALAIFLGLILVAGIAFATVLSL